MSEHGHQQHHGQHGSHGMHGGGGGDAQSFAQILGLEGHGQNGHNFIAHLLGLDHDAHQGHEGIGGQHAPSQSVGWTSALQSLKLSDALQGINVTPNMLFILLFLGFTAWLYVVYWVRHHEPLANDVLGTSTAAAPTSMADRALLNGVKDAFPLRTSHRMGEVYCPIPGGDSAMPLPQPMIPPVPAPPPPPTPLVAQDFPQPGVYSSAFGQPETRTAYLVPVQTSGSLRAKMIVNR